MVMRTYLLKVALYSLNVGATQPRARESGSSPGATFLVRQNPPPPLAPPLRFDESFRI